MTNALKGHGFCDASLGPNPIRPQAVAELSANKKGPQAVAQLRDGLSKGAP